MGDVVEREVAKLTRGEREALIWMDPQGAWSREKPRDALPSDYPGDAMFMMWANRCPLVEGSGLTTGFARYRLTPLGQQAAAHLKGAKS